jgi:hypothetical protein
MPRIAKCDFTEKGCDDPRCKIGACFLAATYAKQEKAAEAAAKDRIEAAKHKAAIVRREEVRRIAIEVAGSAFKEALGRAATPAELKDWLTIPAIQKEAERRIKRREEGTSLDKTGKHDPDQGILL